MLTDTPLRDLGKSLKIKPAGNGIILPIGKKEIYLQNGKACYSESCVDEDKPFCTLTINDKYVSKDHVQIIQDQLVFAKRSEVHYKTAFELGPFFINFNEILLSEPYSSLECRHARKGNFSTVTMHISEFKAISGDLFTVDVDCKILKKK